MNKSVAGHVAAFVTILIWGTTFISTKVLLRVFSPIEILFIRFLIGYAALWCVCPRGLKVKERRQGKRFFVGFLIAMAGIGLISFGSDASLQLNPLGDILALVAAVIWAVYSTITKKISEFGYGTIQTTRRTFFYGLLFMTPVLFLMDFSVSMSMFLDVKMVLNLVFLGLGASALCFVTWNFAVKVLGAIKTTVYIYMVPVITTVTSVLILHEKITLAVGCGIVLTLAGLFLSEDRTQGKND